MIEQELDPKRKVWEKGAIIPGMDPKDFRRDESGFCIKYDQYQGGPLGWEIISLSSGEGTGLYPVSVKRLRPIDDAEIIKERREG